MDSPVFVGGLKAAFACWLTCLFRGHVSSVCVCSCSPVCRRCLAVYRFCLVYFCHSIQFYLYNKGALSQSCSTENRPPMSKPRATVARKNSLADNKKKPWAQPDSEGNHLPLVGTSFNPINLVHLDSRHVGMVTVAGRGCPAGLGWISGPGGGGLGTWARAPGRCPEQGEKKENMFRGFRCSLIKQSRKDRGACVG